MSWKVEEAQQRFNDLIHAATQEPQLIYEQNQLIAVVVEAETFRQFQLWQQQQNPPSLAKALTELHQICEEENYTLEIPTRSDRPNSFA